MLAQVCFVIAAIFYVIMMVKYSHSTNKIKAKNSIVRLSLVFGFMTATFLLEWTVIVFMFLLCCILENGSSSE